MRLPRRGSLGVGYATNALNELVYNTAMSMPDIQRPAILAQLERILASPGFMANERLSRFLEFVVDRSLEGRSDQIKEVVIGLEVFARKPDYDPRRDPVVRTEAAKLRARLAEYYATTGTGDRLVIEIPKGGYAPTFRAAVGPANGSVSSRRWIPVVALAALLAGAGYTLLLHRSRGRQPAESQSIAVLPFANLSTDPTMEYFADGLTDELINALGSVERFRVPGRASAFAFKGKREDIHTIGSKLNVGIVLEGSVRKEGERVRILAQMSRVADGYRIWSQTYDREAANLLTVQDEIARAIVAKLHVTLAATARATGATTNPEAYNLYLKGRYFQNQGITLLEAQRNAITHFERAIESDPNYALAYAGLADSWFNIAINHPAQPRDPYIKAETAAKKAVALSEDLSEAHTSLGRLLADKWDWQHAVAEFRRAIELNPNNGKARLHYAVTLSITDRLDEAIEQARQAQSLDLIAPEVYGQFAMLLHCKRRYDEAIAVARQALEMNPKAMGAQNMLGRSYTQKGALTEAVSAFEKAESFGRRSHWSASLVRLYAQLGHWAHAEKLVAQWKARPIDEFGHAESMALAYAGLGNKDEAFRWLEVAYEQRWPRLPWIKIAPEYDDLRSDPRFEALLKKMGL